MQSLDRQGRVIYMNTFSKSLAPSIRISYMVLPDLLMERFRRELGFYSCTVASFEQHTLARFLDRGWFEKHINRMRKFYKTRRNRVAAALESCPLADRHFLVKVDTLLPDGELVARFRKAGILVQTLSDFYTTGIPEESTHCLVVNYSGLDEAELDRLQKVTL